MIDIDVGNSTLKRVPKKSAVIEFSIPDGGKVRLNGIEILGRPENRIKMKRRRIFR
jgi:RNase P/RNase MRP subunit p29